MDQLLETIASSRMVLPETLSVVQTLLGVIGGHIAQQQMMQVVHVLLGATKDANDWLLRKEALEAIHLLGTLVGQEEPSKLQQVQPLVLKGLEPLRVDRIVHVRNLANTCFKMFAGADGGSSLDAQAGVLGDATNSARPARGGKLMGMEENFVVTKQEPKVVHQRVENTVVSEVTAPPYQRQERVRPGALTKNLKQAQMTDPPRTKKQPAARASSVPKRHPGNSQTRSSIPSRAERQAAAKSIAELRASRQGVPKANDFGVEIYLPEKPRPAVQGIQQPDAEPPEGGDRASRGGGIPLASMDVMVYDDPHRASRGAKGSRSPSLTHELTLHHDSPPTTHSSAHNSPELSPEKSNLSPSPAGQHEQEVVVQATSPQQKAMSPSEAQATLPPSLPVRPVQMQMQMQNPVSMAQMLLDMHTKEIEKFYLEKQEKMVTELRQNFETQVNQMRAALENDIMEVGRASQRAVEAEVENFKRHRLPAITSLLSPLNIAQAGNELQQQQQQPAVQLQQSLQQSAAQLQANKMFDAIDKNNDGVITRSEFAASMLQSHTQQIPPQSTPQRPPVQPQQPLQSPFNPATPQHNAAPTTSTQQQMQRDFEAIMSQLHQNRQQHRVPKQIAESPQLYHNTEMATSGGQNPFGGHVGEGSVAQMQASLSDLAMPKEDLLEQNLSTSLHFRSGANSGHEHHEQQSMQSHLMNNYGNGIPQATMQPHVQPHMTPQPQVAAAQEHAHAQPASAANINLAALGIDPRVLSGLDSSLLSTLNLFSNSQPANPNQNYESPMQPR
eukprot:TRINITY_DN17197_c0_g2_i1.p1 TRINITY_DN17197_c0_g2~~TRINITY_DN17197_c0_g2_i1.p1  ORF type:complete len:784 (-),score=211.55 TRINITY_DN17197_c0_g2_i1:388-2739(-)